MRRLLPFAAALTLVGCGDLPTQPGLLDLEPAFDLHPSSTAGDLDDPDDAFDEVTSNTFARRSAGTFDGDRFYMRTVATDFNEKDFTAELVFTLTNLGSDGASILYLGIGPGTPDPAYHNEATGALFRIHTPDIAGGFSHVAARNAAGGTFNYITNLISNLGPSGTTHRAIITKSGATLTFGFDLGNDGTVDAIDVIADLGAVTDIDNTNSRIYFGTSTQDTFTLSIEVEGDGSADPETVEQCKQGGWVAYGFRNQGQCIRFVNTGKDSR